MRPIDPQGPEDDCQQALSVVKIPDHIEVRSFGGASVGQEAAQSRRLSRRALQFVRLRGLHNQRLFRKCAASTILRES